MIVPRRWVQIGFAHDVFRCAALGQWDAGTQARWLQAFLTPAITAAGGIVRNALDPVAAGAGSWAAAQVASGALPPGAAGWAMLYSGVPVPGMDEWFQPMLGHDLVVGYELSANQIRFLARHRVPFLDIGIDAVRFARRVLFRARSNDPAVQDALHRLRVSDAALAADAGFLCATQGGGSAGDPEDLLFVGQVDVDASLIVGGRIQRVDPCLPRLAELADRHRRLLVFPHPLASENRDARTVLSAIPRSVLGEGRIYPALLHPRTRGIVTLSSSVAAEARLLGKAANPLIEPDGSSDILGPGVVSSHVRLDSTVAQAGFWNAVLRGGRRRRPGFSGHGPDEVALRSALGVFVAAPTMVAPVLPLAPGATVSLADPAQAGLCRLGWSGVEVAGRWTDGPVAVLAFEATAACAGLTLSLHAFIGPEPRTLQVRLLLSSGDGTVAEDVIPFSDEMPREVRLSGPLGPGLVTLKLSMDAPCSPSGLGISPDGRLLGIRLRTLTLGS